MPLKVGYLTIDDGPTSDFRRKVDFLSTKGYPAIFFCRGDRLEERPDDALYAIKKGFLIGNHSYDHPRFSTLSLNDCFQQILKTDEIINKLYHEANIPRPAKLFRFPYGDKGSGQEGEKGWPKDENKRLFMRGIQNYLKKHGYQQPLFENISYKWYKDAGLHLDHDIYWTYNSFDCAVAKYRSTHVKPDHKYIDLDSLIARMDENLPDEGRGLNSIRSNDIILLHDALGIEVLFKPLIEAFSAKGFYFKIPIMDF